MRMRLEPVQHVLQNLNAPHALIGAHAIAARGYPRFTIDIDVLTTTDRVLDAAVWAALADAGAAIDPRRGDVDDPLGGVVHILLSDGTDIDLIVAKWRWEADVIARAADADCGRADRRPPHERSDSAERLPPERR
jgi:hypothetical protein